MPPIDRASSEASVSVADEPRATPYTYADLATALRAVGLTAGDTVFVHACLDTLGPAEGVATPEHAGRLLYRALRDVVGEGGTVVVPTYTFSFCQQELFDVQGTPARSGPWSTSAEFLEYVRTLPSSVRSRDPIHSVAAIGPQARSLVCDLPPTCFGLGSIHHRLMEVGAKICVIGTGLEEATFRHYVEEGVGVPFRFRKLFTGAIRENGSVRKQGWIYYVRILSGSAFPDGRRLEQIARHEGICRAAAVGRGEILGLECRDYYRVTRRELERDPWFTARGPAGDPVVLDDAAVGSPRLSVTLPPDASLRDMVEALWARPRDIVSDGYDVALAALATQLPMTVHEYPTGLECWSWIVPEKWTCHEAYLETLGGKRLLSVSENPLIVVRYSLPFEGDVTRDVLLDHLHVHATLPDATPFVFKYYERDWGLCCSRELRDSLSDDRYRVVIRTSFSFGTLKVGEVVVPGRSDRSIVLCAHLCHPTMVNDDLTGVVVGIDVMRALLARPTPRYTYRFLIVPETIGSIAHLSQHPDLIPTMAGGLFLEMLGRDHPHALQLSYTGTTQVDACLTAMLRRYDPRGWTATFRTLMGNDERQFNAPGVRVPMLSLTRQLSASEPDFPYREYHSSRDTPAVVPWQRLEESRDLVLHMIDALERNVVPVNRFPGEPFCARYGIHVDAFADREGHRALFDLLFLVDGTRSVADIAAAAGISFDAAATIVEQLKHHGLVD